MSIVKVCKIHISFISVLLLVKIEVDGVVFVIVHSHKENCVRNQWSKLALNIHNKKKRQNDEKWNVVRTLYWCLPTALKRNMQL